MIQRKIKPRPLTNKQVIDKPSQAERTAMTKQGNAAAGDPKSLEQTPPTIDRQPTAAEVAAIKKFMALAQETSKVGIQVCADTGKNEIVYDDKDIGLVLLMDAMGTADLNFLYGLIPQLINVNSKGDETDPRGLNFMLSVIRGIKPKDQLEAMLGAQ